jgi:hypothetical protein
LGKLAHLSIEQCVQNAKKWNLHRERMPFVTTKKEKMENTRLREINDACMSKPRPDHNHEEPRTEKDRCYGANFNLAGLVLVEPDQAGTAHGHLALVLPALSSPALLLSHATRPVV